MTTSSRTLEAMRWADVPESLRMTMDDVRGLTHGHLYRTLDDYLERSWLRHQCRAAIEEFDAGNRIGDATRYLGKYRRCGAPAVRGKTMCWPHRRLEPGAPERPPTRVGRRSP